MLSRASRAARRISPCPSTLLYQHLTHTRMVTTDAVERKSKKPEVRTAFVRTWEPPKNIADAYALLRVLERKYGTILEAHFLKDYEDTSKYQMISWIVFEDPKSLQRIPSGGTTFVTPSPNLPKEVYDISMADIEALSQSQDFEEGFEPPIIHPEDKTPVIGGRIIPADIDFTPQKDAMTLHQATPRAVMKSFLQWGGFQTLTPLSEKRTIQESDLFSQTELDNVRMRASLQLASNVLGVQMPTPGVSGAHTQTAMDKPSLSSLVFGDANSSQTGSTSTSKKVESSASIPQNLSDTAQSLQPTKPTITPPSDASPSPPQEKDAETIAAELETQETLKRQLRFARQLKDQSSTMRRKQPKPQIKVARPKPPKFFEDEFLPPAAEERKTGILDKLWTMFKRK